jgi:hypothetical protein
MTEEEFDTEVAAIRKRGVEPRERPRRAKKMECAPERWAAHLEYEAHRKLRPGVRRRQLLAKKGWEERNPDHRAQYARSNSGRAHGQFIQRTYGLHPAQYGAMSEGQGGVCAICDAECSRGHRLSVDHDHETGVVRGLLCARCNLCLGRMEESSELLRKMADYIEAGGTPAFDIVTFYQLATGTSNGNN